MWEEKYHKVPNSNLTFIWSHRMNIFAWLNLHDFLRIRYIFKCQFWSSWSIWISIVVKDWLNITSFLFINAIHYKNFFFLTFVTVWISNMIFVTHNHHSDYHFPMIIIIVRTSISIHDSIPWIVLCYSLNL